MKLFIGNLNKAITVEEFLNKIRNPASLYWSMPKEDYDLQYMPCIAYSDVIRYRPQNINWVKHKGVFETLVFDIQTSYTLEEAKKIPLQWSEFSSIYVQYSFSSYPLRAEKHYNNTHYFKLIANEKGTIFRGHLGSNSHAVRAYPGVFFPVVVPKHRDKVLSVNTCVVRDTWDDIEISINDSRVDYNDAISKTAEGVTINREAFKNIKDSNGNPYYIDITFTKTCEYRYKYWVQEKLPSEMITCKENLTEVSADFIDANNLTPISDFWETDKVTYYGETSSTDNKVSIRFKLSNPSEGVYLARTERIHTDIGWCFVTPVFRII